jgi:hypothetical protein
LPPVSKKPGEKNSAPVRPSWPGVGPYLLADAYADTVWMAERYTPPLPEAVHGLSLPVQVQMDNGQTISARADLVIAGVEESTVEVHDAHPAFALQRSWANRRLDVLAALQMIPAEGRINPFPRSARWSTAT